jgi:hypothetical protein
VLGEARPELCSGASIERVGSDAHNSWPATAVVPKFPVFAKKINPSLRPRHPTGAFKEFTCSTDRIFEITEKGIELDQMI